MEESKVQVGVLAVWFLIIVIGGTLVYGAATSEQSAESNVTVNNYVAIGISSNLSLGIRFGALDPNTNGNNATSNYDGLDNSRNSTYSVDVSSDSNINIDVCIKANAALTKTVGLVAIPIAGYKWDDNLVANHTGMNMSNGVILTTGYVIVNETNIAPSSKDFFRLWLNIPGAQAAGKYNNTMSFKGIVTGAGC